MTEMKPCVIKGCPYPPICRDSKNYTKWKSGPIPGVEYSDYDPEEFEADGGACFCREHAVQYLFPAIDAAKGNTVEGILQDFAADDMM